MDRTPLLSRQSYGSTRSTSIQTTIEIIYARIRYYVPSLDWIPQYSSSAFFHDLIAGITLACLLIPQSIGFATQLAGVPSINGLFSAAIPAIIYPFFCTGRHVSVGPEAPLSLLVAQLVNQLIQTHSSKEPLSDIDSIKFTRTIATLLTFQTGLITFAFGFFRLGFLDALLSKALMRGFVTANAVVISIEQLGSMLSISPLNDSDAHAVDKLTWIYNHLNSTHSLTATISLTSLITLLTLKTFKSTTFCHQKFPFTKFIPEILLVVCFTTLLTKIFEWQNQGVETVGGHDHLTNGIKLVVPWKGLNRKLLKDTFGTSLTICICGFVDSIVAAKSEAAKFHYPVSPNRELVALGISNIFNSFVLGNIPAFGSITRSRLNAASGARTQLASIITGFTILIATYVLLDCLTYLPKAVLAAVITTMVFHFFAQLPPDVIFFWKLRGWTELSLMAFTFLITLMFDTRTGIILSSGVSLVLTVKDATAIRVRILGRHPETREWEPIDPLTRVEGIADDEEEEIPGVLIVRIRESLSFANVGGLKEQLRRLEMFGYRKRHPSQARERDHIIMLVFHLGDVEHFDSSALQIFRDLLLEYQSRDVAVWICHVNPTRLELLRLAGIVEVIGIDRVLPTVNDVLRKAQRLKIISAAGSQVDVSVLRDESLDY
ncbi:hypothetical protein CROQUDRAFT_70118 [Cronartium quercuum f. sp. fusiforme G11]|uniref:STAS domain-containing protein n=1 Tax=Cronartium quercuum f. sp. fusiforme G11 TaxID=708437 RepID=A0A9P6N960_9BASI|nr:hypothetical protein CROQUDRAFT_70118 [Cronartium quercuum f. sp. fusiforme G11]